MSHPKTGKDRAASAALAAGVLGTLGLLAATARCVAPSTSARLEGTWCVKEKPSAIIVLEHGGRGRQFRIVAGKWSGGPSFRWRASDSHLMVTDIGEEGELGVEAKYAFSLEAKSYGTTIHLSEVPQAFRVEGVRYADLAKLEP